MSDTDSKQTDGLTITGAHKQIERASIVVEDDVKIVIHQAYGPKGDSLVGLDDIRFDGHPAITIGVRAGDRDERVHLSPIHGDARKVGMNGLANGVKCELYCPVSGEPLTYVGAVEDGSEATYHAIYLSEKLSDGQSVMLSNVWGHYHSRVIDDMELISYWAATYAT
jgi:hypothetical protein